MSDFHKIKKNAFYTIITISSRLLANVILFWILARFYGPKPFGQFTFAHTLATTFIVFADFGLEVFLTTELASKKGNFERIFEKLFGIKIIFLLVGFILMQLVALSFNLPQSFVWLTLVFGFYLIFTSLNNFFTGVFRGYEEFIYETRASLVSNLSLIALTILFIVIRLEIFYIAVLFALSRTLGTIISINGIKKVDAQIKFLPDFSGLKFLKGKVLIFGFHLIFSFLFFQVDTLLLAKLKGDFSVGIYQAVFKLVMLPLVIPDILIYSFMPTLSRSFVENKDNWIKLSSSMGRILFIFAVPIAFIMVLYSQEIISLVYGTKNYSQAIEVFGVFGLIILVRFCLEPFALMLTTSNRQHIRLITVIIATLLSVSLNLYAIPNYDTLGASVVSLIVNSFVGLVYFFSNTKETRIWLFNLKNILVFASMLLTGYVFYRVIKFNFIFEIIFILIAYGFIIFKFYLTNLEKDLIRQSLKKIERLFKE